MTPLVVRKNGMYGNKIVYFDEQARYYYCYWGVGNRVVRVRLRPDLLGAWLEA